MIAVFGLVSLSTLAKEAPKKAAPVVAKTAPAKKVQPVVEKKVHKKYEHKKDKNAKKTPIIKGHA